MVNGIVRTICKYLLIPLPPVKQPKPSFTEAVSEIVEFNSYIRKQACPNCHKKDSFVAIQYERGGDGFEATVFCTGCRTTSTVNTSGFQYKVVKVPGGKAE